MKKPSLLKTRYAENPFINGDSFSVPLKKKAEVIQTEGPAAVTVGDERIAIAQIRRITTVDSDPFVKLFVAELDRFFDLSPSALRIVTVLIQSIGKLRVGDGDQVFINERAISDTLMQHGLPAPSSDLLPCHRGAYRQRLHRTEREHTPVLLLQPRHLLQWRPGPFRHGNQAKEGLGARTPRAAGASRPPPRSAVE